MRGVCQAQRSLDRRDESRNAIEGGAARMAQVCSPVCRLLLQ